VITNITIVENPRVSDGSVSLPRVIRSLKKRPMS
jgi:hypothetical protein